MTLPSSGALSLNDVRGEFGGPSSNVAINSYYRNGSFVYNVTKNLNVPTSGQIDFNDFYGTEGAGVYGKVTFGTANTGGKLPSTYTGVDTIGHFTSTFGSFQDASITVGSTARTARAVMQGTLVGTSAFIYYYDFNQTSAITTNTFIQVYDTSSLKVDFAHGTASNMFSPTSPAPTNRIEQCGSNSPGTSQGPSSPPSPATEAALPFLIQELDTLFGTKEVTCNDYLDKIFIRNGRNVPLCR